MIQRIKSFFKKEPLKPCDCVHHLKELKKEIENAQVYIKNERKVRSSWIKSSIEEIDNRVKEALKEEIKKLEEKQKEFEREKKQWIITPKEISELRILATKGPILDKFQNRVIDIESKLRMNEIAKG